MHLLPAFDWDVMWLAAWCFCFDFHEMMDSNLELEAK